MITLNNSPDYIRELIQWDSAGLARVKQSQIERVEKPYNHFHIYFVGNDRPYPIHEKSVEEFNLYRRVTSQRRLRF
jgi:hypothetical protein